MDDKKKKVLYLFSGFIGIITFFVILFFPKKDQENNDNLNHEFEINKKNSNIEQLRLELKEKANKITQQNRDILSLKKDLNNGKGQIAGSEDDDIIKPDDTEKKRTKGARKKDIEPIEPIDSDNE